MTKPKRNANAQPEGSPGASRTSLGEKLALVPDRPGVYLMKDREGKVIYVGKAISLRRRVRSYFHGLPRGEGTVPARHAGTKVGQMVAEVADLDWIVTDSEAEALILESNLIKRHRPWFNVKLRDDKAYPYIKVTTNETYPRLVIVRRPQADGARYFGPYTSSTAVRETLQFIRKLFPIRTCQLELDKGQRRSRPCLLYHIGRCPGPCVDGLTTPEEYRQIIDEICLFLEGRQEKLVAGLRQRMKEAAAGLAFERAARLRDVLQAIEKVVERQKIVSPRLGDVDVIGLARDERLALACAAVLFVRDGKLVGRETFFLDWAVPDSNPESSARPPRPPVPPLSPTPMLGASCRPVEAGEVAEILSTFLSRYYAQATFVPPEIWLTAPLRPEDQRLLVAWLGRRRLEVERERNGQVRIIVPRRGERAALVRLADENANEALREYVESTSRREAANQKGMEELARVLGLPGLPWRIEAYDISNLQEREPVAAMVVLEGGEPAPSEYRKFKMRTPGPDDFAMMAEVVERRFRHGLSERQELAAMGLLGTIERRPPAWMTKGGHREPAGGPAKAGPEASPDVGGRRTSARFAILPDLVVIDGGPGQLNAAVEVLDRLGLRALPIIGLAKENEWIYVPGQAEPVILPVHSPALHLLQRVRDEAHRFGLSFHRRLRGRRVLASQLDDVPGIGPARKKALLQAFGSLSGIRRASVEELAAVPGISRELAVRIHEHLGGM